MQDNKALTNFYIYSKTFWESRKVWPSGLSGPLLLLLELTAVVLTQCVFLGFENAEFKKSPMPHSCLESLTITCDCCATLCFPVAEINKAGVDLAQKAGL